MENYFAYLVRLRDSREVNMFGCRPYLMKEFPNLSQKEADEVITSWFRSMRKVQDERMG